MGILGFGQPNIVGLISHASSKPGGSIRGGIESKISLIGLDRPLLSGLGLPLFSHSRW